MASLLLPVFTSIQPYAFDSAMRHTMRQRACVFLGRQTRELAAARLGKRGLERPIRFRDGDGARPDSEVASQIERIVHRVVGGVRARHEHAVHAIRAQRVRTHHGDQTRVHAARQPDDDVGESSVVHEAFERVHAETIPFAILHDSLFLHHHLADPPISARSAKVPEIARFASCAARSASPFREACFRT